MSIVLVVGSVLLVVSAFTWIARRDTVERARALDALRCLPIEDVRAGRLVALRAKALAREPLVDPVTRDRVAFHEARLARVDGPERVLRSFRGGDVFELEDGTGRVEVSLVDADLTLPWQELESAEREPSPRMRQLLEDAGFVVPAPERGARYALLHRAIRPGDELTVVGRPRFDEPLGSSAGERRDTPPVARFVAGEEGLVVTVGELASVQERERDDLAAMTRMVQIAALLGAMLVTLGAALLTRG